jgi:hypothetical protein
MVEQEIIDLINFSPNNLKDFFDKALVDDIMGVPGYGTLRTTPISYAPSEGTQVIAEDINKMIYLRSGLEDPLITE